MKTPKPPHCLISIHLKIISSKEPNYTATQKTSNIVATPGQRHHYYLLTVPANDRVDPAEVFNNIPDPGLKYHAILQN